MLWRNCLCPGSSYSVSELDRDSRQFIDEDEDWESNDCPGAKRYLSRIFFFMCLLNLLLNQWFKMIHRW